MASDLSKLGDKLVLRGLMFHGYHGVKQEEKKLGQKFLIDVDAWMDLRTPGHTDNMADTVSYTSIYRIVKNIVEGPSQNLLESVAQLIATTTLNNHSEISAVRVVVGKPHVAVPGPLDYLVSRSGSLVWQGSAINRVYRTLIPFRGRFLVRGGFVTSVSLLPGRANAGLGLVPAHHILAASICLVGPGAHCDNMVQAQRPGKPIIRHQVPPVHTITDIKCVLSQRAFDVFCEKFHIPEEVHPVLPDRDSTMHERPAGKIGLYTRFFDFANFRLPLSTFLVDILRYFRINISQLSVIGAAKVSHFEILCRVCGITPTVGLFRCFYVNSKKNGWMSFIKRSEKSPVCYTKPLDSLKNWNDHFFWVDEFACPARFPWHTAKNVTRDPAPKATDFSAQDYAILVDHPSPFRKFPEEFLCLVGLSRHYTLDEETYPSFVDRDGEDMDIFAFIRTPDPTKVKVVERERHEGEPRLLEVEQGDSAGGGDGRDTDVQPVATAADTISEDVVPLQPRRHRKRKTVVVDTGGPSHPPKKLREDYETPGGPSVAGKSRSAVQRLLAGAVLNAEVRGEPIPALPFVTSSVSATPEREGGDHIDSVTGLNLRTVSAPQRFVISSDSSHHSGANIAEAEEKTVEPSVFAADSSSAGGDPNAGVFSDLTGSDFLVSGIRTVIDPESDLQKVYVPRWSVTNGSRLDDGRVCREMVDEFAPPKFFASIRGMDHDQLFTEFNVGAARQVSLSAKVRMRAEYNIKEKRKLKTVVDEQADLLKVREGEIESLRAQLLLKEAKAAKAIRLCVEASSFAATEKSLWDEVNALNGRNLILEKERDALDVKVTDLETVIVSKERELSDSNAQLTCIKSQNDNLANQVHELGTSFAGLQKKVTTYENCMEQLKKFQDERMKIVSDKLEKLDIDLVEMALHLEEKFYPHLLTVIVGRSKAIEKGMQDGLAAGITHGQEGRVLTDVAAYNPSAEHVVGASALSLSLDVSSSRVRRIKENIDYHRSALRDVFVPLSEPLSITALTGTEGTSEVMPVTTRIATALSITSASASLIYHISICWEIQVRRSKYC
ncbi:gypsy type transposase [Tanacetum coccineum]